MAMRFIRLASAVSLFVGAMCPIGAHALAHKINSAHVHAHEDGAAHGHEHDAEGHHHDHELRHVDDVPRIGGSDTRFAPETAVGRAALPGEPRALSPSPLLPVSQAVLDPPFLPHRSRVVPSSAGRAPPA